MPLDGTYWEPRSDLIAKYDKMVDWLSDRDHWAQGLWQSDEYLCLGAALYTFDLCCLMKPMARFLVSEHGACAGMNPMRTIARWNDRSSHQELMRVLREFRERIPRLVALGSDEPKVNMVPVHAIDKDAFWRKYGGRLQGKLAVDAPMTVKERVAIAASLVMATGTVSALVALASSTA